ncbi:MAG: hypothetical protein Q8R37_02115 [Nanoarchaeota archaeon]|nr:hypothetical protein [Nanoarchaeota archaeon]
MVRLSKKERTGYFIISLLLILIFAVISVVVFVMNSTQQIDVVDEKGNLVGQASIFVIGRSSGISYKQTVLNAESLTVSKANGASCTDGSDADGTKSIQCASKLCINSICRQSNIAQGGQCMWTDQCQAALYCQKQGSSTSGTCALRLSPDSFCSFQEDQCTSGYHCVLKTCDASATCVAIDYPIPDCGAY